MEGDAMSDAVSTTPFDVDAVLADAAHPVVLFSLSWCSFCRSAKQLLGQLQIAYVDFELDRGRFLEPALQQRVRGRLEELTGSNTLPQLFIGGESIGGYTDTASALRSGRLADVLTRQGVPFHPV
jgi:glutaredoxin